ncbi:MAG TPA: transposase [Tepidisphaeraceae bacterium]|jgi:putative transposase
MPDYRRAHAPGGTFFFTVVTEGRVDIFGNDRARSILHASIHECMKSRPFTLDAIVLLPDHLHSIWTLPPTDANFSTRWAFIKSNFTRRWLEVGGAEQPKTGSRLHNRRRGIWQRRFIEHTIVDERDFSQHLDYLHYNPVKHELASCPHEWPYSTFKKWVSRGVYEEDWACCCQGRGVSAPCFESMPNLEIE